MVDDEAVGSERLAVGDGGGWRLSSPLLERIQTPLGIRTSLSRRRRSRTSESFSTLECRSDFDYQLCFAISYFHIYFLPDPRRRIVLSYGPANERRSLVYKGQSEPSTSHPSFSATCYFYRAGLPEWRRTEAKCEMSTPLSGESGAALAKGK